MMAAVPKADVVVTNPTHFACALKYDAETMNAPMLIGLSIKDVVLIEALNLDVAPGLTALTGETGAGKSIVLDALGLALGETVG